MGAGPWRVAQLPLLFPAPGDYPSGVKAGTSGGVRGRGITRLLESISGSSAGAHRLPGCESPLSPCVPPKDGYRSFSSS